MQDLILPVGIIASVLVILVPLPARADGPAAGEQHHDRRDHAADDDLRADAAGVQHFSLAAAGHDAVPAGAQRGHHAADPHPGRRPTGCMAAGGVVKTFGEFVTGGSTGPTRSSSA